MRNFFRKTALSITKWVGRKFDRFDMIAVPTSLAATAGYMETLYNMKDPFHTIAAVAIAFGSYSAMRVINGIRRGGEEGKAEISKHAIRAGFAAIWTADGFNTIPQVSTILKSGIVSQVALKTLAAVVPFGVLEMAGFVADAIRSNRIKNDGQRYTNHL